MSLARNPRPGKARDYLLRDWRPPPPRVGPYILQYKRDHTRCVLNPGSYLSRRRRLRQRQLRRIQQKRSEEALPSFIFVAVAAFVIQLIRYLL